MVLSSTGTLGPLGQRLCDDRCLAADGLGAAWEVPDHLTSQPLYTFWVGIYGVGLLTVDRLFGQPAQVSEANQAATGRKGETVGEAGHDSPVPDRRQTPGKRSAQFREAERAGPQGRSRVAQRREGRSGSGGRTDPYLPDSVSVSGGGQIVVL